MKIKNGFIKKKVGDVDIVVAVGEASAAFNSLITLNATGSFLWSMLENDVSEEQLVEAMLEKYDIDEATAKNDISAFILKAKTAGVIDE